MFFLGWHRGREFLLEISYSQLSFVLIIGPIEVAFESNGVDPHALELLLFGASSAESKIAYFDLAVLVDENIGGFQVSVDNVC